MGVFSLIKGKATLIIGGLVVASMLSMSGALWWKSNQLEKAELTITNANQTIVNQNASLLQLKSDITRRENAIKDLNTLQDSYEGQIKELNSRIAELGKEIDTVILIEDPVIKAVEIKKVEKKLDDEILNSYNCLMKASGDSSKVCK